MHRLKCGAEEREKLKAKCTKLTERANATDAALAEVESALAEVQTEAQGINRVGAWMGAGAFAVSVVAALRGSLHA